MKKRVLTFSAFLVVLLAISYILFQVGKSRSFQFFGEIYPRIETSQKAVALTFDDGPSADNTDEILQVLREENIKATFYLTGAEIENNPGQIEKIVVERHEIGNHSYNHERMILVSPHFVREEIEKTDALIKKAGYTGEITFRPPFGKKLFVLPLYLARNSRRTITWDVEPETFTDKPDEIIKHTLDNTKNGSIILLHVMYDNRAESMKAVRPIIKNLREKGFEFKTVSELLAMKN